MIGAIALAFVVVARGVVAVPAPSDACIAAAITVLQCHFGGPGDSDSEWMPPSLLPADASDFVAGNPCCATDLAAACGSAPQFLALWNNTLYFEPTRTSVLQTYLKRCPAGECGHEPAFELGRRCFFHVHGFAPEHACL